MQNTDFAWLAGIWDGEGSIYMGHQDKRYAVPVIMMDNTDPNIINKAYQILNYIGVSAHINESKNKKGSTRPVYRLATANLDYIKLFAEKIGPYLVGEKKARLELLYGFVISRLQRGKRSKYSDDEIEIFKDLRSHIRSSETTREASKEEDIVQP